MSAMEDVTATKRKAENGEAAPTKKARSDEVDSKEIASFVHQKWQESVVPTIQKYIAVPNQSPDYDSEWATNGLQEKVVDMLTKWVKEQDVAGLTIETVTEEGRTPLIYIEVPGTDNTDKTILLYGHYDKQPPMTEGWSEGLGPFKPVIRDGKLYGRGGADDGYSIFGAVTAIKALQVQGAVHSRCVIIVEGCEESGSPDLGPYVEKLSFRIGDVTLVICLDSGCGTYNQLWMTTSLRGIAMGTLSVEIIEEGVHSGEASGVIPSTFRIIRQILDRVEDSTTGKILIPELYCDLPKKFEEYAEQAAETLGDHFVSDYPFLGGAKPCEGSVKDLMLNRTWKPTLCYTGVKGIPDVSCAGNVLRPATHLKLSFRTPPNVDASKANEAIEKVLTENPPYGAKVTYNNTMGMNGWASPVMQPWLEKACCDASVTYCNKPSRYMGEGGTIPFMGMLGDKFPKTQFMITGVLGPKSNAHGPNEFLHIETGELVTMCVANVINEHYKH